ncbi:MAG: VCBS domain-containing protein, partial [Methylococcaceae bacterium]|nr:VCBS domain-containing protein [Methylococcaceae bacterium]
MILKRNIVASSALILLLSPPAFSKLFVLGNGNNGNTPVVYPVAKEDSATIIADNVPAVPVTGNVTDNDSNGTSAALTSKATSKYGTIIFNGDGSFSYRLYLNVPEIIALKPGDELVDKFNYAYSDNFGNKVFSTLSIRIIVDGANQPIAEEDVVTIVADKVPAAPVTGNVMTNDRNGNFSSLSSSPTSKYGSIIFNSDGSFSYSLYPNVPEITSLKPGETLVDRFNYAYSNNFGNKVSSALNINIIVDGANQLSAKEDDVSVMPNKVSEVTGNVTANDSNGSFATLISDPASEYGTIIFNNDGSFTYSLYLNSPKVIALKAGEIVVDRFDYSYWNNAGNNVASALNVSIIGNPVDANGNTVFQQPEDSPFDNVDIEFNNRSAQATPVNPGHNIRGHLYNSGDKDWYKITTKGNEIVNLQMCPPGATCFGKKSWVMYVFDSALMDKTIKRDLDGNPIYDAQGNFTYIPTTIKMEDRNYPLSRWIDETGSNVDLAGNILFPSVIDSSNHMYLAYHANYFEGALIGIVDPCYDTNNAVQIGVPNDKPPYYDVDANGQSGTGNAKDGTHDYFIAVSSPLLGDDGSCGNGSVVLKKAGLSALGNEAPTIKANADGTFTTTPGAAKTYDTTISYIVSSPNSDDQYMINIDTIKKNDISIPPLATAEEQFAIFDKVKKSLNLPKIRIGDQLFSSVLALRLEIDGDPLTFSIAAITALTEATPDALQATYNP